MANDYSQQFWEMQMRQEAQADEWAEREAAQRYCYAQGTLHDLIDLLASGDITRDEVLEIIEADREGEMAEAARNQQDLF